MRPGEGLDEVGLAAEFGVSRTPIREVLRQLESLGLAFSRPHRGAIVARLSARQVSETFTVLAELEAVCARLCAQNEGTFDEADFRAASEACAQAAKSGQILVYYNCDDRFHGLIHSGAGNGFLRETVIGIRRRLVPFRYALAPAGDPSLIFEDGHPPITEAILRHDGEAAATAMRDHVLSVRDAVLDRQPRFPFD
ncbi:GntR family transcriptional regulator [Jiella flava]